ncbi:unnamed protein product [Staurois parvus]|uniref:Uncharacterized protein n=1 Tax=Staurois parvus TaxID=386267 RepID=A0ABN9D2V8_9NEOB|nr:unnamed protein product [Staurois parvus]
MLCIRCSSAALISLPGSNLISIPGSNLISFLAAISSASLSCSSGYGGTLSHLDVIRFSTHRAPYTPCSKTWLLSLLPVLSNSVWKTPPLHEYTNIYAV